MKLPVVAAAEVVARWGTPVFEVLKLSDAGEVVFAAEASRVLAPSWADGTNQRQQLLVNARRPGAMSKQVRNVVARHRESGDCEGARNRPEPAVARRRKTRSTNCESSWRKSWTWRKPL